MKLLSLPNLATLMLGATIGLVGMSSCSGYSRNVAPLFLEYRESFRVRVDDVTATSEIFDELSTSRVIAVGETHDRSDHHRVQLFVIDALEQRGVEFAIGLEAFQAQFQSYLDAYVAGEISEELMLERTEYLKRWGYDYQLYRPILRYAREQGISLIALNASSELVKAVSRYGYDELDPTWRNQLPELVLPPDEFYTRRIKAAFDMHTGSDSRRFERFLSVQLLWDEYMAEVAAEYLNANPKRSLVILAGSGHVRNGSGIPERLYTRTGIKTRIVLSGLPDEVPSGAADVIFLTKPKQLTAADRYFQWQLAENSTGLP